MRIWLGWLSFLVLLYGNASPLMAEQAGRAEHKVETIYQGAAARFHELKTQTPPVASQWRNVGEVFYALHKNNSKHERSPDALYSAGISFRIAYRAGKSRDDLARSLGLFRRFSQTYKKNPLADDALMHMAEMLGRNYQDHQSAFLTYQKILHEYPKGDQSPVAMLRADGLRPDVVSRKKTVPAIRLASYKKKKERVPLIRKKHPRNREGTLRRIQYWSTLKWTRVILTLDKKVKYSQNTLKGKGKKSPRFYIDLPSVGVHPGLDTLHQVGDGVVKKIRISTNKDKKTRVVFDLHGLGRFEMKELNLPKENKLVVDLFPPKGRKYSPRILNQKVLKKALKRKARRKVIHSAKMEIAPSQKEAVPSLRFALGLKVKNLVIDAGHGGRDPGAIGFGLQEKKVALKIARYLKKVFNRERPDIKVSLTRNQDKFIPLDQRPLIAKRRGADLFVSIHLNAHKEEWVSGVETYFLNLTTDASAIQVAARENASSAKQINDLNGILMDLLRDSNILESGKLARTLQTSLISKLRVKYPVKNLGVKQAPFMVLIGAEMPSVLIEAGFITNKRENRRLRSSRYLKSIAEGIYLGLKSYIKELKVAHKFPSPPHKKS